MKKNKGVSVALVAVLVLTACSQQAKTKTEPTEEYSSATLTSNVSSEEILGSSGPVEPAKCSVSPAQDMEPLPPYPPVGEDDWVDGDPKAPVTIIEYSEPQCPYCSVFEPNVLAMKKEHPEAVKLVYRHFPLTSIHDKSMLGSQAMEAAGRQNEENFFSMKNLLFDKQAEWSGLTPEKFEEWLVEQSKSLGLNEKQFTEDLKDQAIIDKINDSFESGIKVGVRGTPTVIIQGINYHGARDPDSLWAIVEAIMAAQETYSKDYLANFAQLKIDSPASLQSMIEKYEALRAEYGDDLDKYPLSIAGSPDLFDTIIKFVNLKDRMYDSCPEFTIDRDRQYFATLKTDKGDIIIELFADKAPTAVNSFIFLAKEGWYDNVPFHRVIPGFLAQTGDPSGSGFGIPGYTFGNEISDLLYDKPGVVGMANSGPDTNGSQFFITYDKIPELNGKYTIFGQVIEGFDVLEDLTPRDLSQSGDIPEGDKVLTITIEEK